MRHAEDVTCGGSGLDRAGEVRGDAAALAAAAADPTARTILLWRGKPLMDRSRPAKLLRLPMDHPVLASADPSPILLGREDGAPRFAHDLTGWEPENLDTSQLGGFLDPSEQHHPDFGADEVRHRMSPWAGGNAPALPATHTISRAPTRW